MAPGLVCRIGASAERPFQGVRTMDGQTTTAPQRGDNWRTELEALHERDEELSLFEFWAHDFGVAHDAVNRLVEFTKAVPYHWRWKDLLPCIEKSGELLPMSESERRTLILQNPALKPLVATVTTLFAGYRINMPGEVAPAHRHSPNAVRLGLTGVTNFTSVEGEHIVFGPGDLVLTPHDTWHSHGNEGDVPAINISYLDQPLINVLNATYYDCELWVEENGKRVKKHVQDPNVPRNYSVQTYRRGGLMARNVSHHRGTGNASPMYIYRWEYTRELLDDMCRHPSSPYEGTMVEYTDPTKGGPVYKTITFIAQLLRPGERTLPVRQNASMICTVLEGSGQSKVGDRIFDWEKFDTFCVPGGEWYEHHNNTDKDAVVFIASDEPVLRAVGLYLKHGRAANGEVVRLSDG
jgi:gentisate 1,2-dioxygenase